MILLMVDEAILKKLDAKGGDRYFEPKNDVILQGTAFVLLPDYFAGELCVYGHLHFALRTFDNDFGNAARLVFILDMLTNFVVLDKIRRKLLFARIPLRVPFFYDADAQTVGIDFLTHDYLSSLVSRMTVMWLVRFKMWCALPLLTGWKRLSVGP